MRYRFIRLALDAMAAAGIDRLAAPRLAGRGAILTFHHVRPDRVAHFDENAGLSITPDFLDRALNLVHALGYGIVPLDEVPARLADSGSGTRFVALTFDDGYRDMLDHALPVLRRHGAPFTLFVCPGFAERAAPLWWLDIDEAVMRLAAVRLALPGGDFAAPARSGAEKRAAFRALYWRLRGLDEGALRAAVAALCRQAGVDPRARVERLCLDWEGLRAVAADPRATIGAHTLTHPRLARLDAHAAAAEMLESRARIAGMLSAEPQHIAYPVGDRMSAGPREFALAAEMGFITGLTTVPGTLFPAHARALHALPRISVNGLFQDERYLRVLLSGAPFLASGRLSAASAPSSG